MLEVIDPQGVHGAKVQAWSQCNVPSCAMPSYLALLTMVNFVPSNGNVTDTEYILIQLGKIKYLGTSNIYPTQHRQ